MAKSKTKLAPLRVERPSATKEQAAADAARLTADMPAIRGDQNKVRIVANVTQKQRRELKAKALLADMDLQDMILEALHAKHPEIIGPV